MKLLLASKENFLLEKGYSALDIPKDQMRIGAINTALNFVVNEAYLQYMREYRENMRLSGISFEEFDIKDKSKDEILDFFKDKNIIQIFGGSPFYLLKSLREVGFEEILKYLFSKGLVYVGCSAGSYILCPTIEVGGWKLDRDRHGLTDFTSFGYVPYLIKCHYLDEQEKDVREKAKHLKYPLRVLKDDQAILIEDGKETFIGDTEEIKIS
jgi:dipeptidase E